MSTLRAAAELLSAANSLDALEPIASLIGCAPASPLSGDALHSLGLDDSIRDARVACGPGAIRALLAVSDKPLRELLPRLAARLTARAPHVLWMALVAAPERSELAIAAWTDDKRPPRVRALLADRRRIVDSDAETLRALAAAHDSRDILAHTRWVEILGRDALTARFYRGLQRAVAGLAASSSTGNAAARSQIALLNTSRLLFLCFLEAKGWLDRDHAFLAHRFNECATSGGRFHDRVVRPLFFGTLNTPVRRRSAAAHRFGTIPFLNGGLFTRTPTERRERGITFSDDAYGALIFDLFAQFRFTAAEESATWSEAAVDPEMLGHAFESLMASGERRNSGAFFTPFSLVERTAACALERVGDRIDRITVLDPACGSGAFLVHVLEHLSGRVRELGDTRDIGRIRHDVLARSIFGVDVNPTAVWLCQLRLWLSVVIESGEPAPLPNLDRNIRVGDALSGAAFDVLERSGGASLERLRERYARATGTRKQSLARELDRAERRRAIAVLEAGLGNVAERRRDLIAARRGRDLFGGRYHPSRDERHAAIALRERAGSLRAARRRIIAGGALPFSWAVHFADVAARGGFDVVIGNPPWVRLHRIPPEQRALFRSEYDVARAAAWTAGASPSGAGSGFAAQVDLAALFVERSIRLTASGGTVALLVPAKLWRSLAGGGVRALSTSACSVLRVEDYSSAPAVFDAAVYPSLVVLVTNGAKLKRRDASADLAVHHRGNHYTWRAPLALLAFDGTTGAPWVLLPMEARRAFDRLRRIGRPMAESAIGRPLLGVKCGCNDAFLVELVDVRGDVANVMASNGVPITVERSVVRPLLRGEQLRRWRSPNSQASILWTHGSGDTPLASLPPLTNQWLGRWRHALAARSDARGRGRWWSLFRTESARCDRPRVVWADVGREPRASVLDVGDRRVPLNTCYVARCRDLRDAHAFAALLNGPLARAWLNAIAEPARGGYRRYLGWTLSLLPIPSDWDRACEVLAPLGIAACLGATPSESDLLEAAAEAYGVEHDEIAPLVAWTSE